MISFEFEKPLQLGFDNGSEGFKIHLGFFCVVIQAHTPSECYTAFIIDVIETTWRVIVNDQIYVDVDLFRSVLGETDHHFTPTAEKLCKVTPSGNPYLVVEGRLMTTRKHLYWVAKALGWRGSRGWHILAYNQTLDHVCDLYTHEHDMIKYLVDASAKDYMPYQA